jgi:hypothetical protein
VLRPSVDLPAIVQVPYLYPNLDPLDLAPRYLTYTPAIELLALGVTLRTHETQKSVATLGSTSVITLMGALYNGLL